LPAGWGVQELLSRGERVEKTGLRNE
jgi:hypothetical protein